MKIAIGLFGFMRMPTKGFSETLHFFLRKLKGVTEVHLYIYCPETTHEFSDDLLNSANIQEQLREKDKPRIVADIKTYKYRPHEFIEYAERLNYNFITGNNIYTHRILSLHFNISRICRYIFDKGHEYDFTILTRYDMLPRIHDFGDINRFRERDTIFIWRTCPYISNEDAEDRIIVTSRNGLDKLSMLYNDHDILRIKDKDLYSERVIGKQLDLYKDLMKKPQDILMDLSPFHQAKYTEEFRAKCYELLNNYRLSKESGK